jgi:hypothetical protein
VTCFTVPSSESFSSNTDTDNNNSSTSIMMIEQPLVAVWATCALRRLCERVEESRGRCGPRAVVREFITGNEGRVIPWRGDPRVLSGVNTPQEWLAVVGSWAGDVGNNSI